MSKKLCYTVLPPLHADTTDPAEYADYYSVPAEGANETFTVRCLIASKERTLTLHNLQSVYEDWISHFHITRIECFLRKDGADHFCVALIHTGPSKRQLSDITIYWEEE